MHTHSPSPLTHTLTHTRTQPTEGAAAAAPYVEESGGGGEVTVVHVELLGKSYNISVCRAVCLCVCVLGREGGIRRECVCEREGVCIWGWEESVGNPSLRSPICPHTPHHQQHEKTSGALLRRRLHLCGLPPHRNPKALRPHQGTYSHTHSNACMHA